jgi:hypothetical protein
MKSGGRAFLVSFLSLHISRSMKRKNGRDVDDLPPPRKRPKRKEGREREVEAMKRKTKAKMKVKVKAKKDGRTKSKTSKNGTSSKVIVKKEEEEETYEATGADPFAFLGLSSDEEEEEEGDMAPSSSDDDSDSDSEYDNDEEIIKGDFAEESEEEGDFMEEDVGDSDMELMMSSSQVKKEDKIQKKKLSASDLEEEASGLSDLTQEAHEGSLLDQCWGFLNLIYSISDFNHEKPQYSKTLTNWPHPISHLKRPRYCSLNNQEEEEELCLQEEEENAEEQERRRREEGKRREEAGHQQAGGERRKKGTETRGREVGRRGREVVISKSIPEAKLDSDPDDPLEEWRQLTKETWTWLRSKALTIPNTANTTTTSPSSSASSDPSSSSSSSSATTTTTIAPSSTPTVLTTETILLGKNGYGSNANEIVAGRPPNPEGGRAEVGVTGEEKGEVEGMGKKAEEEAQQEELKEDKKEEEDEVVEDKELQQLGEIRKRRSRLPSEVVERLATELQGAMVRLIANVLRRRHERGLRLQLSLPFLLVLILIPLPLLPLHPSSLTLLSQVNPKASQGCILGSNSVHAPRVSCPLCFPPCSLSLSHSLFSFFLPNSQSDPSSKSSLHSQYQQSDLFQVHG